MRVFAPLLLFFVLPVTLYTLSESVIERFAPAAVFRWLGLDMALDLDGADLRAVSLRGRDLFGARLRAADLRGVDLVESSLEWADLAGAKLAGADLSRAILLRARLGGADLDGAVLDKADLREANLEGALNLTRAQMDAAVVNELTMLPDYLKTVNMGDEQPALATLSLERVAAIPLPFAPESVAVSADGSLLASFGQKKKEVYLWRVGANLTYRQLSSLNEGDSDVRFVAVNPANGEVVATGNEKNVVRLWRVGEEAPFKTLDAGAPVEGYVFALKFSADGQRLVSASFNDQRKEKTVRVWNVESGEVISAARVGRDWVVDINADRGLMATDATDAQGGLLRSVATGDVLRPLEGSRSIIFNGAFSQDGNYLALGVEADGSAKVLVWRVDDGLPEGGPLTGPRGQPACVAFSHDRQFLAAGWTSGSISLWRVADGQLLQDVSAHGKEVYDVAFSADGRVFASAGADQMVRLWRVAAK